MKEKDLIRYAMQIEQISQEELAKKAGYKAQTNITGILNRCSSMRVDIFVRLMNAMGYTVKVVKEGKREVLGEVTFEGTVRKVDADTKEG